MDNPCKNCQRTALCDHFQRCLRWRLWFSSEWRNVRTLFGRELMT